MGHDVFSPRIPVETYPFGPHLLELPARWDVVASLVPPEVEPDGDAAQQVRRAVASPLGMPSLESLLSGAGKIVLVVDDASRSTPAHEIVPALLALMDDCGVASDRLSLFFAGGVHTHMTRREMERKVSAAVVERLHPYQNESRNLQQMDSFGVTSRSTPIYVNKHVARADLRILVGSISPHLWAGFGGGWKNVVPGSAHITTIAANHNIVTSPDGYHFAGKSPEQCPLRLDIEEACARLDGETFIVNVVLDAALGVLRVFAGHPVEAHRAGCAFLRSYGGFPADGLVDVLITSAAPLHRNLRQGFKCISNALNLVKPDGVIVAVLEISEGLEDIGSLQKMAPFLGIGKRVLELIGAERVAELLRRSRMKRLGEEKFMLYYGLQMLRRNRIFFVSETLDRELPAGLPWARVCPSLERVFEEVDNLFDGSSRPRVALAPYGGMTFVADADNK